MTIPNFWDPKAQLERPELPATRTIRFLVDDDFPPLHFPGLDGNPTGLSVELARAACERLASPARFRSAASICFSTP